MITIVLPISRTDYLKPVFDCLNALERPEDTELLILTDGNKELQDKVDKRLDSINYTRIRVVNFGDEPAEDRPTRRFRISAIHNKAKNLIPDECDYVFSIEDDTTYPANALSKMLGFFDYYEECAFVQGVELGRHKSKYVGAWVADDVFEPYIINSLMPDYTPHEIDLLAMKESVLERIDAGGLYCALIKANLYKQHHFEPYDKVGEIGLSCDLNFGLWLRQNGYACFMDWSIQCDHIGEKGSVNLGNTKPVQVIFEKRKNKWLARTV